MHIVHTGNMLILELDASFVVRSLIDKGWWMTYDRGRMTDGRKPTADELRD
jgi:hypothetical protein